ncbi:MAG: twin-arginine translocase subunit TatC [Chitinivibrionales bacterium]|nr:twin-arginine translocase subunit TatC [Chitinivibrionales bacterium]
MSPEERELPFLEHLEELRWRLIKSIAAVVVLAIPCGVFWQRIFDLVMIYPLRFADPKPNLIVTSPVEAVLLSLKIAIAGGIVLGTPVIFYQLWRFVSPGLYKNEKVVILPGVFFSTISFLLGVSFCYFILPHVVKFLAGFAEGRMVAMYRTNEYLAFLLKLSLAFGLVFELPVLSYVLTRLGLITPKFLIDKFRYALVVVFILAAILTPPDVLSQLLLAAPLLALYGISIIVSFFVARKQS